MQMTQNTPYHYGCRCHYWSAAHVRNWFILSFFACAAAVKRQSLIDNDILYSFFFSSFFSRVDEKEGNWLLRWSGLQWINWFNSRGFSFQKICFPWFFDQFFLFVLFEFILYWLSYKSFEGGILIGFFSRVDWFKLISNEWSIKLNGIAKWWSMRFIILS